MYYDFPPSTLACHVMSCHGTWGTRNCDMSQYMAPMYLTCNSTWPPSDSTWPSSYSTWPQRQSAWPNVIVHVPMP